MKTKPKRIRALKAHIDQKGHVATTWEAVRDDTPYEPCYILRQSDIRALAGQFVQCSVEFHKLPEPDAEDRERMVGSALYALRRAGMTPGRRVK